MSSSTRFAALRLAPKERGLLEEIVQRAGTLEARPRPILEEVVPKLRELLDAELAGAYRASPPEEGSSGWQCDFVYGLPWGPNLFAAYLATQRSRSLMHTFDLLEPEPDQRNVVRQPSVEIPLREYARTALFQQVFEPAGIAHHHQMRVLLCDGPLLMAWVGVLRPTRFKARERALLGALIAPLRTRLSLERSLIRAELLEKGIAAALDLSAETAFLCTRDGRVAYASAAALARLDNEPGLKSRLLEILHRGGPGASRVSLRVPGLPEHVLIAFGAGPDVREGERGFASRIERARRTWRLTPRQAQVLGRVVHGDSNKQIAERFRCTENTIEVHVSALLRKARAQGRVGLASRFWTLSDS
jgi:DNA-binding CsgD family transcriptional regulator